MKNYKTIPVVVNDNGNDLIKSINENYNKIQFLNIIAEVTDPEAQEHIKTEETFKVKRENIYECLDVTIHKNANKLGRYYLADLAIEYFGTKAERRNQNIPKAKAEQTYICSSVATALNFILSHCDKLEINAGNIMSAGLLPMGEFKEEELRNAMVENLKGTYKLEFHRGSLAGRVVEFNVDEEDAFVFPEGGIALDGEGYNLDGTVNEEYLRKIQDRYVIGFDIGSMSTDMGGMLNGNPVPKLCDHVGEGITQSLNKIKQVVEAYIKNEYGKKVEITTDELNAVILNLDYKYPFAQNSIDIKSFVETELNRNIKSIISEFDNKIDINMNNKIYGIYTFGGGSILMSDLVKSRLENRFEILGVEDPVWYNAISAVKVVKNIRLDLIEEQKESKNKND